MRTRARIIAAVLGLAAAAGLLFIGSVPTAHADGAHQVPTGIFFVNDPGLISGTCNVIPVVRGVEGTAFHFVVVTPGLRGHRPVHGSATIVERGRFVLNPVVVPEGTLILVVATGLPPARDIATY